MPTLGPGPLLVATHNEGKMEEFRALLAPRGLRLVSAAELGLAVPEETGTTFVENARLKAVAGAEASGLVTLADDSGLCVDALGGAPGVQTADWAETPNGRDFVVAMQRTHDMLVDSGAAQPWHAQFRCTLVLRWPTGDEAVFEGVLEGELVWPMRGAGGHGYDPIFRPRGQSVTMGEMALAEKNRISHRAAALQALAAACFT